jgi:steroid delta-isomerase-like uncharacterized protein
MDLFRVVFYSVTALIFLFSSGYAGDSTLTKMEKENIKTVRYVHSELDKGNWKVFDEVLTSDYVRHCQAMPPDLQEMHGAERLKTFIKDFLSGVSDLNETIDVIMADSDKVAYVLTMTGKQTGPMGDLPASGKKFNSVNIIVQRFENGKIAETWVSWDNLDFLRQLGFFPPPAPSAETMAGDTDKIEARKALARRWFEEVINQRNLNAIDEIYSPDFRYHGPDGLELQGTDAVRKFAAAILAASNDRHAVVEQQVAEGDLIVTRFISTGHFTAPYRGIEPTGELWTTEGIDISRIVNGKIVEGWEVFHNTGL